MKVAILCLFALVAVSQAAFTVNLKQRAQPILAKTFAQARWGVRADGDLQTTLFQTLSEHANQLLEQIQTGISSGVETVTGIYQDLMSTVGSLQELGGSAVDAATEILSNFWTSLFGRSTRALDIGHILQVLQSLNLNDIIGFALQGVAALIAQLEVPAFIETALNAILSSDIVQNIMAALFPIGNKRGLFGDLIGNVVSGLTGAANALAAQVAQIVSGIQGSLEEALPQMQAIAQQLLEQAQNQIGDLAEGAIQQIVAALGPLASQMNGAYDQILAVFQGLLGNSKF